MNHSSAWKLTFSLAEYTPQEVERITGLSSAMQRDWRHRGYLPKTGKHARYDILGLAEIFFMKVYSDQGKGPGLSSVHAPRVAAVLTKNAFVWRSDAWASDPDVVFDAIPKSERRLTQSEIDDIDRPERLLDIPKENRGSYFYEKREWLASALFSELRIAAYHASQSVVWWPTGEVTIGSFDADGGATAQEGTFLDRVDPRHSGPALVLNVEAFAANLVRQLPRPCIAARVEILRDGEPSARIKAPGRNNGEVIVERQREAKGASDA